MVDPHTAKLILNFVHKITKSKKFRSIIVGIFLLAIFIPTAVIFAIGSLASTPSAIFHWGKTSSDYSGGDKKTLNQYNTMQSAFKSAMDDTHKSLLDTIQRDVSANGYVAPSAVKNQAYTGGRPLFAVSAVVTSRPSVSVTTAGGISDGLRQKLLEDVGRLAGRSDAIVAAIQNDTTQDQMENDVASDMEGRGKSPQAITKVLNAMDSDFSSYTAPVQPSSPSGGGSGFSGGKTQPSPPSTPPVQEPPKVTYTVSDDYSDASLIGTADFAISAYSLLTGEDAGSDGFGKAVRQKASAYFTYDKTVSADGKTVTYSVHYNPSAGTTVFGLSANQCTEVAQLSANLQLLVAKLEGKASSVTIVAGLDNNGTGVSDSLVAFIEKWEGYMANWYDDGYGTQTIGYGHIEALPAGFSVPLTAESADALLRYDLSSYIASVQTEFAGTDLKQNQIDALVSLCYNLGPNIWSKISLTNDVKSNAPADVIQRDFQALDHAKGVESAGLLNRRMAEYQAFENGVYTY